MNSVRGLRNHLEMFQQTYSNALTESSPLAQQPPHVQTPLRLHQLASLEAMREKELGLRTGWKVPGTEETLFSRYAYLGDRVGVGKTLMVLGHISQMATQPLRPQPILSNLHPSSTAACFSIAPHSTSTHVYDSLIVVPHTIYKQWQDTIENQTTLKAHFLKSQRDLDKENLLTSLQSSHCVLISNTLLQSFLVNLEARTPNETTRWRRVFFDEADSIKISGGCPTPIANITWYVTASYSNMLCINNYYHSYLIRQLPPPFIQSLDPELQEILQLHIDTHPTVTFFRVTSPNYFQDIKSTHPLRAHLVIRSSKTFLDNSIQLPTLHQTIIRCQTPMQQQLLDQVMPPETETLLHAGDISGALQSLGVSSHTPLTIIDAVTEFRKRELDRLRRVYQFKENETYSNPQAKETALALLQYKIKTAELHLESLQKRIEEATKESCSICFDAPTEPVLVPCCSKMFCGSCILSWMTRTPACPLCRTSFHPSELKRIGQECCATKRSILPKKIDALLQILQENPNGKFLIFSRYENPLLSIQETIQEHYPTATLQGHKDSIAKTLSDFESGYFKILLLNSRQAAAGMNIPTATHVILLHKMAMEEEKQILGRAYRLGRTAPLQFIKLLHQRE
jgi:SNF2 family DNA or RNA helicase